MTESTGHVDTFSRDALPPKSLWPEMRYDRIPELSYPARMNCAAELLDRMVERGHADRPVFHFPDGRWTYAQLLEHAVRAFDSGIGVEADERARREQAELYAKIGQLTVEKDFLSRRSGR